MTLYLLTGIPVDDLLEDWSKHCRKHGMEFGAVDAPGVQKVLVVAEGKECTVHIGNADGKDAVDTANRYIEHIRCRRPDVEVLIPASEAEARERSRLEDIVALMLPN